jgi:hypothetical protein
MTSRVLRMVTTPGYARACQIAPGGQFRAGGKQPGLDGHSNRPVDLCIQRYPSGTIEVNAGGVSHHAMVQSELQISVLFTTGIGPHLLFYNQRRERLDNITLVGWGYGGMVATGALAGMHDKIKAMIYLDAFVPENGKALVDYVPAEVVSNCSGFMQKDIPIPPPPRGSRVDRSHFEKTCRSKARRSALADLLPACAGAECFARYPDCLSLALWTGLR